MNNCRKNHSSSVPFFCILFASNLESNSHMEIFIQTFLFFLFFSFLLFLFIYLFIYFFYLKPFLLSMNVQPVVFFGHLLSLIHQYSPSNKPVQHYQFSRQVTHSCQYTSMKIAFSVAYPLPDKIESFQHKSSI